MATARGAARRLGAFVADSPLCADALVPRARIGYRLASHLPLAIGVLAGVSVAAGRGTHPWAWLAAFSAALGGGAALPRLVARAAQPAGVRQPADRRAEPRAAPAGPLWRIVAARQTLTRGLGSMLVVAAGLAAVVAALAAAADRAGPGTGLLTPGGMTRAVLTLGVLLALTRIDDAVVRFAAFAGHGASATLVAHLVPAAVFTVTLALLALAGPPGAAAVVAAVALVAGGVTALRVWAYRCRPHRAADRIIALDALAAAVLASLALPLAPAWLAVRAVAYFRAARRATWALA